MYVIYIPKGECGRIFYTLTNFLLNIGALNTERFTYSLLNNRLPPAGPTIYFTILDHLSKQWIGPQKTVLMLPCIVEHTDLSVSPNTHVHVELCTFNSVVHFLSLCQLECKPQQQDSEDPMVRIFASKINILEILYLIFVCIWVQSIFDIKRRESHHVCIQNNWDLFAHDPKSCPQQTPLCHQTSQKLKLWNVG